MKNEAKDEISGLTNCNIIRGEHSQSIGIRPRVLINAWARYFFIVIGFSVLTLAFWLGLSFRLGGTMTVLVGVLDEPVPGDGSRGLPRPGEMWEGRVVSDTGVTAKLGAIYSAS